MVDWGNNSELFGEVDEAEVFNLVNTFGFCVDGCCDFDNRLPVAVWRASSKPSLVLLASHAVRGQRRLTASNSIL